MQPNISPTEKLLLCCARSQRSDRGQNTIPFLIKKKINWERFIIRARTLGIAPRCYFYLKKAEVQVPSEIEKTLHDIYTLNLIQNMKLWATLIKILRAFNDAHIDVIPLKGPLLSDAIHGRIGVRTSGDLDLLIRKKDFSRVRQELAKIEYFPMKLPYSEEFIMEFLRHRPFIKGTNLSLNPMVEIHWSFYTQRPQEFDMTPVWKTAVPKNIENTPFLSLSVSYTLIHLAITLRIHGYLNFRHFSDLDALLTNFKDKIDWEYTVKQAVINKQRTALFYALYFTKELLDTEIPPHILDHIKPSWFQKKLVTLVVSPQKILLGGIKGNSIFHSDFVNLLITDSFRDAIKISQKTIFSHTEDMIIRYKKSSSLEKSILSSPIRPFYLIWSIIKNLYSLLKK